MDFNTILAETQCQIALLLEEQPASVTELWQIWAGKISQQSLDADANRDMEHQNGLKNFQIFSSSC